MSTPTTGPCRKCAVEDRNSSGACRPCAKEWRATHKAALCEYNKDYYAADRSARQEKQRSYYKNNRVAVRSRAAVAYDPKKAREYNMRRNYNLSVEERAAMEVRQHGVCAICFQPEMAIDKRTDKPMALSVDRNHRTGAVRGLLCWHCNTGIGKFRDDPFLLRAAADYLEHFQ